MPGQICMNTFIGTVYDEDEQVYLCQYSGSYCSPPMGTTVYTGNCGMTTGTGCSGGCVPMESSVNLGEPQGAESEALANNFSVTDKLFEEGMDRFVKSKDAFKARAGVSTVRQVGGFSLGDSERLVGLYECQFEVERGEENRYRIGFEVNALPGDPDGKIVDLRKVRESEVIQSGVIEGQAGADRYLLFLKG